MITVAGLYYYPIKSCHAENTALLTFDQFGLMGDRRGMLIENKGAKWTFITQRTDPGLALVDVKFLDRCQTKILLSAPNMRFHQHQVQTTGENHRTKVFESRVMGVDQGDTIANWFSTYLGRTVRLIWTYPAFDRPVSQKHTTTTAQVAFADGYPILIASDASLAEYNRHTPIPLPMNRFRPNIVLAGCTPHEEDTWKEIIIGEQRIELTHPCRRCKITRTSQETATLDPIKVGDILKRYRGDYTFGMNAIHQTNHPIQLDDKVEIITYRS